MSTKTAWKRVRGIDSALRREDDEVIDIELDTRSSISTCDSVNNEDNGELKYESSEGSPIKEGLLDEIPLKDESVGANMPVECDLRRVESEKTPISRETSDPTVRYRPRDKRERARKVRRIPAFDIEFKEWSAEMEYQEFVSLSTGSMDTEKKDVRFPRAKNETYPATTGQVYKPKVTRTSPSDTRHSGHKMRYTSPHWRSSGDCEQNSNDPTNHSWIRRKYEGKYIDDSSLKLKKNMKVTLFIVGKHKVVSTTKPIEETTQSEKTKSMPLTASNGVSRPISQESAIDIYSKPPNGERRDTPLTVGSRRYLASKRLNENIFDSSRNSNHEKVLGGTFANQYDNESRKGSVNNDNVRYIDSKSSKACEVSLIGE